MNLCAQFHGLIASILGRIGASGRLPADLDLQRFVVEPPRDSARWRPFHQCGDGGLCAGGAFLLRQSAPARRGNCPLARRRSRCRGGRSRGRASSISACSRWFLPESCALFSTRDRGLAGPPCGAQKTKGQCRICLGEPARAVCLLRRRAQGFSSSGRRARGQWPGAAPPFAPAAERWALTAELSIIMSAGGSRSSTRAAKIFGHTRVCSRDCTG
jgi:hypothetical protein